MSDTPEATNPEAAAPSGGFDWGAEVAALGETADPPAEGAEPAAPTEDKTPAETPSGKVEAPKPAEPAEAKTDDTDAKRARAILAAAEKKEREAATSLADFKRKLAETMRTDPRAAMAELGTSLDEAIDAATIGSRPAPEEKTETPAEMAERIKRELRDELKADQAERENTAKYHAEVARVQGLVKADKRFPLINAEDGAATVTDEMVKYYEQHGKPIAWDACAKLIETELEAKADRLAALRGYVKGKAPAAPAKSETLGNDEVRRNAPPAAPAEADPHAGLSGDRLIEKLVREAERAAATNN